MTADDDRNARQTQTTRDRKAERGVMMTIADLIADFVQLRHPFKQGFKAQRDVDF